MKYQVIKKFYYYFIFFIFPLFLSFSNNINLGQTAQIFKNNNESIRYLLYLPENYYKDSTKKWPIIIFYHGSGECGKNLNLLKKHGIPKFVENKKDFPFIVISPQYELDENYNILNDTSIKTYNLFIQHIISVYKIDPKRIYLTGLSFGGHITWKKALQHPYIFTAIAPVCGYPNNENFNNPKVPENISVLKNMPIWIFHGAKDNKVNIIHSNIMANSLKKINKNLKYTIFPDKGHNIQYDVYEKNENLYKWFLKYKKD